jgi:hypothetical protein
MTPCGARGRDTGDEIVDTVSVSRRAVARAALATVVSL